MRKPIHQSARRWLAVPAFGIGLVSAWAQPGFAIDWQIQQSASARLTYSDNVDLDPDAQAEEALVPSATYSLSGIGQGGRVLFASDTTVTFLAQSNEDYNPEVDQNINLFGRGELWSDRLFLDAAITSRQELIDVGSAASASGVSGQNERDSVTTFSISPIYQQRIGNWADGQLGYRHSEIIATGDTDDATVDTANLTVTSGSRFGAWRPSFVAGWFNMDEDIARSSNSEDDIEQFGVQLDNSFRISRKYALLATVGYDEVDAPTSSRDFTGFFWSVGANATPGPRTQLSFQVGHRFDTLGVNGTGSYQVTPNLALNVSASQDIGTALQRSGTQVQRLTIDTMQGGLAGNNGLPSGFLRGNLDDGISTNQDVGFGLVGTYGRNTITFGGNFARREFDDGTERTATTRLAWSRALSRRLSVTLSGFYRYVDDREADDVGVGLGNVDTHLIGERIDVNYQLGPTFSVFAGASRTDRFSEDSREEFTENSVSIGGRITF